MSGFSDATVAGETMKTVVAQVDSASLKNMRIVYSYRFTDLDWSFTLVVQDGGMQMFEGMLPESETTIETTSDVFDKVMTGAMNVATAHLTNQARIHGSVGNILALRTIVPVLGEAYRAVREGQTYSP